MTNKVTATARSPYHHLTSPAYITDSNSTLNSCGSVDLQNKNKSNRTIMQQQPKLSDTENIDGTYHDYFLVDVKTIERQIEMPKGKRRGPRGGVVVPFPVKLYAMLEGVEKEGLEHIVSWLPHGRSFAVHKPSEFVKDIMPRYFRQSKLTSFQRQLNLYGFMRLSTGRDRGAYWHELFLRGRPELCKIMLRTRVKGNGLKPPPTPAIEPNFYEYPICNACCLSLPTKPIINKPVRAQSIIPDVEPTPIPLMYPLTRRETSSNETLKQVLDVFGVAEINSSDESSDESDSSVNFRETTQPIQSVIPSVPQWHSTPFSVYSNFNGRATPSTFYTPLATVSPMPIKQVSDANISTSFLPDVSIKSFSTSSNDSVTSSISGKRASSASSLAKPMAPAPSIYPLPSTGGSSNVNRNTNVFSIANTRHPYWRVSTDYSEAETGFFEGHKFACVDDASLDEFENKLIGAGSARNPGKQVHYQRN